MKSILDSAQGSLVAGLVLVAIVLVLWMGLAGLDALGFVSFLLRWLHVLGAMVWVGLIFFVNFIQFAALERADEAGRSTLARLVVPKVAASFRHASHLTVLSGLLLLVTSGYLLDRIVFTSAVYIPPLRNILLWGGVAAGLAMWAFVHFLIWPNLRIVLGETTPADPAAVGRAREQVRTYARLNLVLALPVTFVMVAATHLY
ncbi:MAG TPA: hypothetical protein VLA62_03445 [Solirubrobacterales bacterium]|nr:hypothetical protein [Solirubrobacterales bacterium]